MSRHGEAARAIGAVVDRLAAAGAQHLLVPNLPDIGKAPAVGLLGLAWAAEQARRLSLVDHRGAQREPAWIDARHGLRALPAGPSSCSPTRLLRPSRPRSASRT